MSLLDQSGVTGGGLDPYNALFLNMDNMWTEGFGNYDCLVFKPDIKSSVARRTAKHPNSYVQLLYLIKYE